MNTKLTSFVSAATALLALFAFWPSVQPAADWFLTMSGSLLSRPVVQAVMTSITVGVLLSSFLPHLQFSFVQRWVPGTTKAITRLLCASVTFASCYVLIHPQTPIEQQSALVFCLLSAVASAQVWTTLAGLLYRVKSRPESLK